MNRLLTLMLALGFALMPLLRPGAGTCGSPFMDEGCGCCETAYVESSGGGCCEDPETGDAGRAAMPACGCAVREGAQEPMEPVQRVGSSPEPLQSIFQTVEHPVLPPVASTTQARRITDAPPDATGRTLRMYLNSWLC